MPEILALSEVRFGPDGLVPVVAQESRSGDVLMLAYADRDALERTIASGWAHYHSRSRGALWQKGATSGNVQRVVEIQLDCDRDAVLYRVEQTGPACHAGTHSCFADDAGGHILGRLAGTIAQRAAESTPGSYTVRLLEAGVPKVSQKVGEEAVEVVIAANAQSDERLVAESADLVYHLLVLLQARGVPVERLWRELDARDGSRHGKDAQPGLARTAAVFPEGAAR